MGGYELENKAEREEHVFSLNNCLISFDLPRGLHIFLLFLSRSQTKSFHYQNYKTFELF